MPRPTTSAVVAWHLLRRLRAEGHRLPPVCSVDPDTRPDFETRLSDDEVQALFAWAAIEAGPGIAVRAARIPWADHYSLVQLVARSEGTVRSGLSRMVKLWGAITDASEWSLRDDDARGLTLTLHHPALGPGAARMVEFYLADALYTARLATLGRFRATEVHLSFPSPAAADFPDPIRLDAATTGFHIDATAADLPLKGADPAVARALAEAIGALVTPVAQGDTETRVRRFIARHLKSGPTLAAAARQLGRSPRSLERDLAGVGTSFRQILADERYQRAQQWLGAHSVDEVADRLGYASARPFRRAFRAWSGRSPSAWRKEQPAYSSTQTSVTSVHAASVAPSSATQARQDASLEVTKAHEAAESTS